MKFISKRINALKEELTDINHEKLNSMSVSEQSIIALIGVIKNDYVVFVLGFFSSVVIDEFVGLFSRRVSEDSLGFVLSLINVFLFIIINISFLNASISFSELQEKYKSKPTSAAGFNMLINSFESTKEQTHSVIKHVNRGFLFCVFAFCINVSHFIYINL